MTKKTNKSRRRTFGSMRGGQFNPAVLFVVILVVAFAVGFGFGFFKGKSSMDAELQNIILGLEDKLEKARAYFPFPPEYVYSLSGTVTEVKDNAVIFEFFGFGNPLEEYIKVRKAVIGENTKILKQVLKSSEEIEKENQEFQALQKKAMKKGESAPMPLEAFKNVETGLEDIKVGDNVFVESEENIKELIEFGAIRIVIQ